MELFDITKIIFENHEDWKQVSSFDKKKAFFALNRRFSIKFPLQANVLQHVKINPIDVVDFWFTFLSKSNDKTPYWMYVKGVKKTQEVKEKKSTISKELFNEYCRINEFDRKSVEDAMEFFPEESVKEIKQFEKMIKS